MMILNREYFLTFIVDVLGGMKTTTRPSNIMKTVAGAAERILGTKQFLPENLHEYMIEKQHMNSSQMTRCGSMEEFNVDVDAGE